MFSWQTIDALPLFASSIRVLLEETKQQYHFILCLKNGAYEIDENLISKITFFYQNQLDKVMYYETQLKKWAAHSSPIQTSSISTLLEIVNEIRNVNYSIIKLADTLLTNKNNTDILIADKNLLINFIENQSKARK